MAQSCSAKDPKKIVGFHAFLVFLSFLGLPSGAASSSSFARFAGFLVFDFGLDFSFATDSAGFLMFLEIWGWRSRAGRKCYLKPPVVFFNDGCILI